MLSIDEAIAKERNLAEIYINYIVPKEDYHNMPWIDMDNELNKRRAKGHKQLAEWLEELKAYREIGTVEECKNSVLDIQKAYNKALNDFIHECDKYCGFYIGNNKIITREDILKIAEQLKE